MRFSPAKILISGFLFLIFLGTFLLMLPAAVQPGKNLTLLQALFTSTSAVCVTGLSVVDTGSTFNLFGKIILTALVQIGGLGFMSFNVLFFLVLGKKIGLKERIILKEGFNLDSIQGIVALVKSIFLLTLCIESIGAFLSFLVFSQNFPFMDAVGISIFHAISAFNNAGIDILGNHSSNLMAYKDHLFLNLVTTSLIILGGLGFLVHKEILKKRSFKKLSLHSKIVLSSTAFLLVIGTLVLYTTQNITLLEAYFHSVSSRTAGFNTIDLENLTPSGKMFLMILMFIGGSSGSTAGGIKVTTAFIIIYTIYAFISNRERVIFNRQIATDTVIKAFVITFLAMGLIVFDIIFLSFFEKTDLLDLMFDIVSAFATVGLSTRVVKDLTAISQLVLILTMFLGRLGPLTVALALGQKRSLHVQYPEEKILVG